MSPHTRRAVAFVAITALLLALPAFGAPAASAGGRYRARLLKLVNASREAHDLAPLGLDRDLSVDAKAHTRKMIRQGRIFDPHDVGEILQGYPWNRLGAATVGCAGSLNELRKAWMRSDEHREILLHPDLEMVGFGVVRPDGHPDPCGSDAFWATGIYYG
jgi:uncharacterized protein YkwD